MSYFLSKIFLVKVITFIFFTTINCKPSNKSIGNEDKNPIDALSINGALLDDKNREYISLSSFRNGMRLVSAMSGQNNFYFTNGSFYFSIGRSALSSSKDESSESKSFHFNLVSENSDSVEIDKKKFKLPSGVAVYGGKNANLKEPLFVGKGVNAYVIPVYYKDNPDEIFVLKIMKKKENLTSIQKLAFVLRPYFIKKNMYEKGKSLDQIMNDRGKVFAKDEINQSLEWIVWGNTLKSWKVQNDDTTMVFKTYIEGKDLKDIIRLGEFDEIKQAKLMEFLLQMNQKVHIHKLKGERATLFAGFIKDKNGGNIRWDKKNMRWVLVDANSVDLTGGDDGIGILKKNIKEFRDNMLMSPLKNIARIFSPNHIKYTDKFTKNDMADFLAKLDLAVDNIEKGSKYLGYNEALKLETEKIKYTYVVKANPFDVFKNKPTDVRDSFLTFFESKMKKFDFLLPEKFTWEDFKNKDVIKDKLGTKYVDIGEFLESNLEEFQKEYSKNNVKLDLPKFIDFKPLYKINPSSIKNEGGSVLKKIKLR